MAAELREYAQMMADAMEEWDVSDIDVLDALASAGLTLVTAFENEAMFTYMDAVAEEGS